MKKCSILAIKEMQLKTILGFHFTPIRMTYSRAITTTNAGEDATKQEHLDAVGGNAN
jgi:hypothetical protein